MDLKELEKLAKLCRKYGITSLEDNGLKLSFSDSIPTSPKAQAEAKEIAEEAVNEEDVLFWSSQTAQSA